MWRDGVAEFGKVKVWLRKVRYVMRWLCNECFVRRGGVLVQLSTVQLCFGLAWLSSVAVLQSVGTQRIVVVRRDVALCRLGIVRPC